MPGFRSYPHLDMVETGRLAGKLLRDALDGRLKPVTAMARVPLLPNMLRAVTSEQPMAQLTAAAEAERGGMPCVTVFSGFPLSDTPDSVLSVVATSNGDIAEAEAVAKRI